MNIVMHGDGLTWPSGISPRSIAKTTEHPQDPGHAITSKHLALKISGIVKQKVSYSCECCLSLFGFNPCTDVDLGVKSVLNHLYTDNGSPCNMSVSVTKDIKFVTRRRNFFFLADVAPVVVDKKRDDPAEVLSTSLPRKKDISM